ncbi:hypothetical protein TheetDRAFT_3312 [Thermoanaerobacter ethanolicus JW 200]|nr:hypothetical protein TheetDRAFT_3312 [Thermoanaerobacter ethanolicus JW 200]
MKLKGGDNSLTSKEFSLEKFKCRTDFKRAKE